MANTVVDDQRTTPLTGQAVNSAVQRRGLVFVAMAVASFLICVLSFAARQIDAGVGAASLSLLAAGAALAYRSADLRRVRQVQRDGDSTRHGVTN